MSRITCQLSRNVAINAVVLMATPCPKSLHGKGENLGDPDARSASGRAASASSSFQPLEDKKEKKCITSHQLPSPTSSMSHRGIFNKTHHLSFPV